MVDRLNVTLMVIYVLNAQDFLMIRTDDLPILEHTKQQEKVRRRWATHPLKSWFLKLSQGKLQLKYKRFQRKNSKSEHDRRNYVINVCVTVFPIRKVKAVTVSGQRKNPSDSSQQHSERKTTRSNPNRYTTPVQEKKGYHYNMVTRYH